MCFGDPVDNHGVPQAPLLLYLADQRPKHRKRYGKGGRYGAQVRAAGRGWRGKDDPRFRPHDEPPPAGQRGGGPDHGDGGNRGGFVYPPGPRQGGGGGRVRVPPGVNAGGGNGGASIASGAPDPGGHGPRRPAPRGGGQRNGGGERDEPPGPVVRDFGADAGSDGEEAGAQAPGMRFDAHTERTPTILSDSSSGDGSGAGAGAGTGRSRRGHGGDVDGGMWRVSLNVVF